MRVIRVPVCVGVMKSTLNNEMPLFTVQPEPYSSGFDDYLWFRAEMPIRIQQDVTETHLEPELEAGEAFEPVSKGV